MDEIKKEDIKQEVFDLYDYYVHNKIDRREFVEKISFYAVGGLTVPAMLNFLMPKYQQTLQVPVDDPRLKTETVGYNSLKGAGKMQGQLSRPVKAKGKLPGIVVVHENRGLNPHIADVGRRAALEGFISMSPDALFPLGGYPGNDDDGREMQRKRDRDEMLEDFIAAYDYLKGHPECNGKIGVVGFCFGGWISNMMAVKIPTLKASVPFYGGQPTAEETAQIKVSMLIQYAGLDTRVNEGWPAYETALKANKVDYQVYIYPDVNHGFHNDSTPRYDKEAAVLAWGRTVEFFKKKLG
ncbi:MAG: dienelactone hydrolase family protein [Imperialibacter sp.]|uniref:dienelactone hydrolase family protein n=1 Tax=Imperialibacter sp. TaxID=2038411 RepID=UPI0032EC32C0